MNHLMLTGSTTKEHIQLQGIECLRLGKPAFNKVRYSDVQKKLQAFPVFSALKVNEQISHMCAPDRSLQDQMAKMDSTLGTILHGLLLQREAFSDSMNTLINIHPVVKKDVQRLLVASESSFRSLSDDVLQYVCGRRAEVIEQRRRAFTPRNAQVASLLESIPPSSTHLFETDSLADLTKQYGDSFRPFRASFKKTPRRITSNQNFNRQAKTSKPFF